MTLLWLPLAVGAYLLLAVNGVADKFLLSKAVRHPIAYAFYTGITGPLVWVLAPFGLKLLSLPDLLVAILGGACFPVALYFFDKAIQQTSISRILPIEGGLVPIFTLVLAYLILGERLSGSHFIAFLLLVCGAVLISFRREHGLWHPVALGNATIAAFLFAMSFVLTKYIYGHSNFVSGLIWTRLGFFAASLSFLLVPLWRGYIFEAPKKVSNPNKLLYYGTRLTGMAAGFMQNYAIAIGSVTLVNAMQGTQYVFLLILTSILSLRFPQVLKEQINRQILVQKILAIIIVSVGLVLLAL
jgi:drug/metabolite transporter (DMT)-like permease